jgi:DNA-binding transcriptional LysR family regulator
MTLDKLAHMAVFAKVVEAEGFTAAASQLGMSKSAVSKAVTALEERLGARLLNRTTRRLSLTEVGRAFYERSARVVSEAEEAELAVTHLQERPRGTLRINAPVSFGVLHLASALADFMRSQPEIRVDAEFTDRYVDVVDEGFDVVVRIAVQLPDSTLIARRLTENRMVVCASPAYWARTGRPARPQDLGGHACLTYAYNRNPNEWPFAEEGRPFGVRVAGPLQTNNGDVSLRAALAGLGVVRLPRFICGPHLASGALEPVLQAFAPAPASVFAVYPHNRHLSAKVRVFVDFLIARFGPSCDWDNPPD